MGGKSGYWRLCCAAMAVLSILAFTPAVIPEGITEPGLWGLPLTLWAGMAIALIMILVTVIAVLVHPERPDKTAIGE